MARFILSAFSDEYSSELDKQIEGMVKNKVKMSEVRGVDGINVSDLTTAQAMDVKKRLEAYGIGVSALGSPIGKIKITDPMDPHLDKLKHTAELAAILGTKRIRMFSFYMPEGTQGNYDDYRNEVIDRMGQMLDVADAYDVYLCHENEKGIYGDTPERCLELLTAYEGKLRCVFDPANFIQCGCEPYPHSFEMLYPYLTYMHIKDCAKNGTVVPAGKGIGCIPEILSIINNARKGSDFILTAEPHLRVFDGLSALENGEVTTHVGNTFSTAEEAFEVAITAIRNCYPRTAE